MFNKTFFSNAQMIGGLLAATIFEFLFYQACLSLSMPVNLISHGKRIWKNKISLKGGS